MFSKNQRIFRVVKQDAPQCGVILLLVSKRVKASKINLELGLALKFSNVVKEINFK